MMETRICGIPCLVEVTYSHYTRPWQGSAHNCPSDIDYYGGWEVEYEVLDRRGRKAEWLERKMTPADHDRLLGEIIKDLEEDHGAF